MNFVAALNLTEPRTSDTFAVHSHCMAKTLDVLNIEKVCQSAPFAAAIMAHPISILTDEPFRS